MEKLRENKALRNKVYVFTDRSEAGRLLSKELSDYKDSGGIVLAIPSGGVPVAKEINKSLSLDFDLLIVRKVQIPWNPEAGFAAANLDGDVVYNKKILNVLNLSEHEINIQIKKTQEILNMRNELFRKGKDFPEIEERVTIVVDDGLASGYTMLAAVKYIRKRRPSKLIVAVPTGSYKTIKKLSREIDALYCLNVREGYPFAVADAYQQWYDLSDEEVLEIMKRQ